MEHQESVTLHSCLGFSVLSILVTNCCSFINFDSKQQENIDFSGILLLLLVSLSQCWCSIAVLRNAEKIREFLDSDVSGSDGLISIVFDNIENMAWFANSMFTGILLKPLSVFLFKILPTLSVHLFLSNLATLMTFFVLYLLPKQKLYTDIHKCTRNILFLCLLSIVVSIFIMDENRVQEFMVPEICISTGTHSCLLVSVLPKITSSLIQLFFTVVCYFLFCCYFREYKIDPRPSKKWELSLKFIFMPVKYSTIYFLGRVKYLLLLQQTTLSTS
jgi:hypothetical protein